MLKSQNAFELITHRSCHRFFFLVLLPVIINLPSAEKSKGERKKRERKKREKEKKCEKEGMMKSEREEIFWNVNSFPRTESHYKFSLLILITNWITIFSLSFFLFPIFSFFPLCIFSLLSKKERKKERREEMNGSQTQIKVSSLSTRYIFSILIIQHLTQHFSLSFHPSFSSFSLKGKFRFIIVRMREKDREIKERKKEEKETFCNFNKKECFLI